MCFCSEKKPHLCLLTSPCMAACLILCVCVSIHECVWGQKWRCYPVVIHHTRDTCSPALLYTEAMFYKRITRQRAPGGHPLPPCATCKNAPGLPLHSLHIFTYLPPVEQDKVSLQGEILIPLTSASCLIFLLLSCSGEIEDETIGRIMAQELFAPTPDPFTMHTFEHF